MLSKKKGCLIDPPLSYYFMYNFFLSTFDTVATIGSVSNYKPVGPIAETNFGKVGNGSADSAYCACCGGGLGQVGFY